ncbi:MAG: queuosine salvage family protein [Candidatus Xenobiia bacterium LiM19]
MTEKLNHREDRLGVLSSCLLVARSAKDVHIDENKAADAARQIAEQHIEIPPCDLYFHYSDDTVRSLYYVLVLDALNFCFWGLPGEKRWCITCNGREYNGYRALALALKNAFLQEVPLWEPRYLASMTDDALHAVLHKDGNGVTIPLFHQRRSNLNEVGEVLLKDYEGDYRAYVEAFSGDAVAFVNAVVKDFPSFRDRARYHDLAVKFYKRAQILVSDTAAICSGKSWGSFKNLHELTAFADYKIPQVLRRLGILVYSERLAGLVDSRTLLEAGSAEEVEIRASTVGAVDYLRCELEKAGYKHSAAEVDWLLWHMGQEPSPADRPYHLTRTVFY